MPSNGEHSSCITTICFLGTHSSQLCCQLSSCLLVYHTEKLRTHGWDLLKIGHFCFSLKCFPNVLSFLQNVQQALYWMTPADPWQQGRLRIVNKLHSVQFSRSVMSDSLRPHGPQQTRPPCPSPTPRVYSNSCPLSWWCHPTISSSVIPISSCLQSFPASGSFPMSQFFASGDQSIGVSASASVLPMNIQDWFPLGLTGWISLQSKGLSRVFSNTTVQKHQFSDAQLSLPTPVFLPGESQGPGSLAGLPSMGSHRVRHDWSDCSSSSSFLYSPTLTSIHDYWKNYSFD